MQSPLETTTPTPTDSRTDYCLYSSDGEVLTVVEASSRAVLATLKAALGSDEISLNGENMLKAFDAFILEHNYSADQPRFLRVVQSVFLQRRTIN